MTHRSETSETPPTGTVARTVRVLAAVADAEGTVGVGKLAERLGLATSTVHRILQLLRQEGFVQGEGDTRQYGIGPEYYRVAARVVSSVDLVDLARPYVRALAARFDETVLFGLHIPASRALSFAARADGGQALQYRIEMNRPLALAWGASGKAVLAHLPLQEILATLEHEGPAPASGMPLPPQDELLTELERIRKVGYAVSEAEKLPAARGIAAPVFGPSGVMGCLVLTCPKDRFPKDSIQSIGAEIVTQAQELSRELGADPHTKHDKER